MGKVLFFISFVECSDPLPAGRELFAGGSIYFPLLPHHHDEMRYFISSSGSELLIQGKVLMGSVRRIFVEKRAGYDIAAQGLLADLRDNLGMTALSGVRIVIRYDVEGISDEAYKAARQTIFSEPPVDIVYDEVLFLRNGERVFVIEYLPGQYDQRADSTAQCIQLLTHGDRPAIATAQVYLCSGELTEAMFTTIKHYCVNPVDSREASLEKPATLAMEAQAPPDVAVISGFVEMSSRELDLLRASLGLAMHLDDVKFCRTYFRDTEKRDPTLTEIRVLDTYWSDHCRHTTFLTKIKKIEIEQGHFSAPVEKALHAYHLSRGYVYETHPRTLCLMDIATIGMKELKKRGVLYDLDASEEINACSIVVPVEIDGRQEEWLVMFKNETHNHPTEIEPFGGAATCLGGAIRDPLSGRSYVYQAMRVTGAADPRRPVGETLPGKLPQRKLTVLAAQGYSSYGNQIGLATGQVVELYDEGFMAKRMEIGAVVGAVPRAHVNRSRPAPGDLVLLLGGRTGRDGCGGATGSSKEHTEVSLATCSAEVQKGNPLIERKIQRLFRNPEVGRMIKRCNDFGAGGVSVAIGELAAGLDIDLDAVPKKYEGLDGTELAISESQERMAVVIAPEDLERFAAAVAGENLESSVVARVGEERRLRMRWRGATIVDISRDFIDTNGITRSAAVKVAEPDARENYFKTSIPADKGIHEPRTAWLATLADLNVCSQQGLVERFDSTIGAASVLLPFGGVYQKTPAQCMVARLPVTEGETATGTAMSFGYNPHIARWSPFHGALYAVVEAAAKIVAAGGNHHRIRLTLQEYFEKPGDDPGKWGKPFAALLGAYWAQTRLKIPAIGGKDSMSGTFKELQVPPTLVAFALAPIDVNSVISPEFKQSGSTVVLVKALRDTHEVPDFIELDRIYTAVCRAVAAGQVHAAAAIGPGGCAETVSKMSFGNRIGLRFSAAVDPMALFTPDPGSLILEVSERAAVNELFGGHSVHTLGTTTEEPLIVAGNETFTIEELQRAWESPLGSVFPIAAHTVEAAREMPCHNGRSMKRPTQKTAQPRALITVFPGTNCEYDTMRAFTRAGAVCDEFIMKNLSAADIDASIELMVEKVRASQIVMIPGGFSAGDEPEGSGKFIAAFFRNPHIRDAITDLLDKRDGLMLGICNGFQALIKLGLVPYGTIRDMDENSPTLTFNTIGRHISRMVSTRIVSVKSPWLAHTAPGDIHVIPISHGEGRFIAPQATIEALFAGGQVATQYVDCTGACSATAEANPNGSLYAIEGVTSPDGRVFGKMGHSERKGKNVAKNIYGNKDQMIFEAGVEYFR
ncbi:MAG: phosphoribosylformylglycinamidine synthase [Chitinispirillaceae bacterium]|nr:phosphoribosylformylglycinamidine synthase [Chitinispirillaceae bacterium]